MALIMFSGMFGFGEMVSYISFMGDGRKGLLMWMLGYSINSTLKNFLKNRVCELCLLAYFISNKRFHLSAFLYLTFYVFYL